MLEAFDAIMLRCTRLITTREQANQQPFIISDLFGLCRKYLTNNKQLFFKSKCLEDIMALLMRTIGIGHTEAAENHQFFSDDLLAILRDDFRVELKVWNLFVLTDITYDQLVQEAQVNNPEITNMQEHPLIQSSELSVLQFYLRDGNQIIHAYLKEIAQVPIASISCQL